MNESIIRPCAHAADGVCRVVCSPTEPDPRQNEAFSADTFRANGEVFREHEKPLRGVDYR